MNQVFRTGLEDLVLFFLRRMVIICDNKGEDHGQKTCLSSLRDGNEKMEDPRVFHLELGLPVGMFQ
jgi:hypothetical protein